MRDGTNLTALCRILDGYPLRRSLFFPRSKRNQKQEKKLNLCASIHYEIITKALRTDTNENARFFFYFGWNKMPMLTLLQGDISKKETDHGS